MAKSPPRRLGRRNRLDLEPNGLGTVGRDETELRACIEFLDRQTRLGPVKPDDQAAWTDLAHVLFNAKEFIFVE